MTVYPIELSTQLSQLLESDNLSSALTLTDTSAEAQWIKAIAYIEHDEKAQGFALLRTLEGNDKYGLASQIELMINQPIHYFKNTTLMKELTKVSTQLPKNRLLARLLHALAIIMMWRRNTPQALKHLYQSRDIYRLLNEEIGLSRILDTLGNVMCAIADQEQAMLYYTESLAIKTAHDDTQGQAITLGNLARLCLQFGRYQQAKSFVNLDLKLCRGEDNETQSRLLNLLARIEIADNQPKNAEEHLNSAISLIGSRANESLFFCLKDLALIKIEQQSITEADNLLADIGRVEPQNSSYHMVLRKIVHNKLLQVKEGIELSEAEILLNDIIKLDIPELEIEYRIWLTELAKQKENTLVAQHQLLLARKKARKNGLKRFLPQITTLVLDMKLTENIQEEAIRPISDDLIRVEDGYFIRKKLGHGGFGEVFLAHDMMHDRDVAIKRFHSDNLIDHRQQNRIWDQARLELEAVANIKHPCIAKTFALGHDATGSPYLVQEYISGGDITGLMESSQDLATALIYLIPITRALAALHESGVIHRDVKPENILMNSQGSTVLIDFGIALLKQHANAEQRVQGTELYIAPEQKVTTNITFKADLYSLGCILYLWITGEHYAPQPNQSNKISSWLGLNKSAKNAVFEKNVDEKAIPLLGKLLAINPDDRPESTSLVADNMAELLNNLNS